MTTITGAFELLRAEDVRAVGFVVKLRRVHPGAKEAVLFAREDAITPAVQQGAARPRRSGKRARTRAPRVVALRTSWGPPNAAEALSYARVRAEGADDTHVHIAIKTAA